MVDTIPSPAGAGDQSAQETQSYRRRKSYTQGLLLLLIVVVLWTASNFLTNALLTTGGYDKPFFVTYANTSSFALYLVPYLLSSRLRKRWSNASADPKRYTRLSQDVEGETRGQEEEMMEDDKDEIPKWLKTLGFDVPTVTAEEQAAAPREAAQIVKPFALLAEEQQQRGRVGNKPSSTSVKHKPIRLTTSLQQPTQSDSSTASTPLLATTPPVSRPSSPVRPFLVSTSVPRPSSIDGRRPRTSISIVRPTDSTPILPATAVTLPPLTLRETAILASQFTLVWFGANWAINAGLGLTSVASGTTIGSASGFFTLALGAMVGVDRFTLPRLGAVCISALGVAAVTFADRDTATNSIVPSSEAILDGLWKRSSPPTSNISVFGKPPNAPLGDLLALLSAFLYSLYVMLLKTRIGSEDRISMPLMFGIVGTINIVCLWPILPILHYTRIEPFSLPPTPSIWAGIVVNMCITFISDFIYLLAMLKSSPLITTLGLSLTIPLAVVIDALKGSHTGGAVSVMGSGAVLCSFGFIGWDDRRLFREEREKARVQQVRRGEEVFTNDDSDLRGAEGRAEVDRVHKTSIQGTSRDSSAITIDSLHDSD
ncbi:putative vacuolar membrane protein [Pseudozyma hubeiensis]|nr:putative vacuolar membrane protein [Pseudozyma hubeiensis]